MTIERTTQPMADAVVERLTLVEKLEQKESEVSQMMQADDAPFPYHYMAGKLNAFREIINIVKQHSEWISVDEQLPPDNMMVLAYCNIRETVGYAFVSQQQAWSFYHFTKNSENQAMAMVNDISKWMPIPQPPSEVQERL